MKKVLRIVMAFILVQAAFFSVLPVNAAANDISGHWAQAQINDWMEKGLVKGYTDGTFKPDNSISRAECFAMINSAFGFTKKSAEAFEDVDQKWYAEDIAKARAQGYLKGYTDNTARPDKPITRQEIIAIVARILRLNPDEATLSVYPDAKSVSGWARGSVGAIGRLGYFNVYEDKSLRPGKNATRAEVVWMLAKAAGTMYNAKGIYGQEKDTQVINGNVTISGSDVTLRNTIIKGNLYLSEGIAGRAVLENITAEGVTTLCGAPASLNGKFGRLLIEANKAQVSINGGTVSELTINADDCVLTIRDMVSVTTLNINRPARVSGKCIVGTANINADNVTVEANPTVVNVGTGRKGVSVTAAAPVAIITSGNSGGNTGGNTGGNPGGNTGGNTGGGTTTPTAITVTGMDPIPDINAAYGTSPGAITLPSSVTLQLSDSTTTAAGITAWDTTAFVPNKSGTYTFNGTLALPDGISNPGSISPAVHLNIGVQPELIADSYVVKGQAADMPETVTVRLDEITTVAAGINWDLAGFSTNTLGSFPLRGTLVMPEGTSDPAGTTVSMVMRVTDPIADPNPGTSMVQSRGTVINEFDEIGAGLSYENAVVELDTTNKVSGSGSLRITSNVPSGGGNIAITNRVNMNLSAMQNLQFDVYIPDKSQLDGISLRLFNSGTAHFSRYTGSWRLVNGWNRITVGKSDFLSHEEADWNNAITSIVVTFCANSGCKPCVNLDAIAYNISAKTNILFTFDDGWYDLIDGAISGNAYSCLQEKGFKATVWAKKISSAYGGNTHVTEDAVNDTGHPKYMNETDLTMLYNEGWDIGNHTVNHYDSISGRSDEQIRLEYQECQQWLIDRNWTRGAYFAAYPSGVYNERIIEQLRSIGVLAARTTAYGLQSIPVDNMYKLKCICLDTTLTRDAAMAALRSEIDRAAETGTTLIFMFHKVEDSADPLAITTGEFRSIVDYVDARRSNINVITFSEWYNAYVDAAVTAVTPLQDIECDIGTAAGDAGLPSQVEIWLGDTRTVFVPVTWDTSGYDATKAGTYPITGMLQLPYGIANSSGLTANVNVILKGTTPPVVRNITTIAAIDLITVDAGTTLSAIKLPAQVLVTLDDVSTEMLNVNWNPDGYNGEAPGTYPLTGTLQLPEGIANPSDLTVTVNVTVRDTSAPVVRNITTIAAIDLITVDAGTILSAIKLPAQVQVTLDDASTEMLNVSWNPDGYNGEVPGTYPLTGTLQLPEGIANPSGHTVTVYVTVRGTSAPVVRNITTIAAIDLIMVDTGTTLSAIKLPAQVQVTLDDASTEMLNVNWNPDGYNGEVPETYTLTGEIVLPEGITNNTNIKAQVQITVRDPIPV